MVNNFIGIHLDFRVTVHWESYNEVCVCVGGYDHNGGTNYHTIFNYILHNTGQKQYNTVGRARLICSESAIMVALVSFFLTS